MINVLNKSKFTELISHKIFLFKYMLNILMLTIGALKLTSTTLCRPSICEPELCEPFLAVNLSFLAHKFCGFFYGTYLSIVHKLDVI
jgi:hypothetical protein